MKYLTKQRNIIFIWLIWALVMVGYQAYVRARYEVERPDYAVFWVPGETRPNSHKAQPYLLEPFLNDHVAWDSEYYLSIAVGGLDDPRMRAIPADYNWNNPEVALKSDRPDWTTMNYAFYPFYPFVMRIVAFPLGVFGPNPIAAATLAGVLVSAVGTLIAMLALYDLTLAHFGESERKRAIFYLLIFPAGMFLIQVYTEGLFLGLSFGALALARREKWLWAGLLAACAVWTRAAGALLLLPLAWYWWRSGGLDRLIHKFSLAEIGKVILIGSPLLSYLLWQVALGAPFRIVSERFFSRQVLALGASLDAWNYAFQALLGHDPQVPAAYMSQTQAYYLVEFAAIALSLVACLLMWRRDRLLSLYSLAIIVFSLTSGAAQGMHRYVMTAPVVFMIPARWGENEVFDRGWIIGNVLLMGVFAAMFSVDFWAG
jgi:Gpi18-like mannosyltransferase